MFWYFIFIFLILLLHDNHVQPVYTFLSCTFLLILIFKSTVYCHAHFNILYFGLYILFFIYFILCIFPLCLYSIIFALSMERTCLTFHCWLYTLYIIVYVTNKNLESHTLISQLSICGDLSFQYFRYPLHWRTAGRAEHEFRVWVTILGCMSRHFHFLSLSLYFGCGKLLIADWSVCMSHIWSRKR